MLGFLLGALLRGQTREAGAVKRGRAQEFTPSTPQWKRPKAADSQGSPKEDHFIGGLFL